MPKETQSGLMKAIWKNPEIAHQRYDTALDDLVAFAQNPAEQFPTRESLITDITTVGKNLQTILSATGDIIRTNGRFNTGFNARTDDEIVHVEATDKKIAIRTWNDPMSTEGLEVTIPTGTSSRAIAQYAVSFRHNKDGFERSTIDSRRRMQRTRYVNDVKTAINAVLSVLPVPSKT